MTATPPPRDSRWAWVQRAAQSVGAALFALLFAVFMVQIAARFLWGQPLPWTDEAAVVLYMWVIFWAGSTQVKPHEHVAFDLLTSHLPTRWGQRLHALGGIIAGALAASALPTTWEYLRFMAREQTAVLGVPFFWVFLPIVGVLLAMVWHGLVSLRLLWRTWHLGADRA